MGGKLPYGPKPDHLTLTQQEYDILQTDAYEEIRRSLKTDEAVSLEKIFFEKDFNPFWIEGDSMATQEQQFTHLLSDEEYAALSPKNKVAYLRWRDTEVREGRGNGDLVATPAEENPTPAPKRKKKPEPEAESEGNPPWEHGQIYTTEQHPGTATFTMPTNTNVSAEGYPLVRPVYAPNRLMKVVFDNVSDSLCDPKRPVYTAKLVGEMRFYEDEPNNNIDYAFVEYDKAVRLGAYMISLLRAYAAVIENDYEEIPEMTEDNFETMMSLVPEFTPRADGNNRFTIYTLWGFDLLNGLNVNLYMSDSALLHPHDYFIEQLGFIRQAMVTSKKISTPKNTPVQPGKAVDKNEGRKQYDNKFNPLDLVGLEPARNFETHKEFMDAVTNRELESFVPYSVTIKRIETYGGTTGDGTAYFNFSLYSTHKGRPDEATIKFNAANPKRAGGDVMTAAEKAKILRFMKSGESESVDWTVICYLNNGVKNPYADVIAVYDNSGGKSVEYTGPISEEV